MDEVERRSLEAQAAVGLASFLTPFLYGALSVAMPTMSVAFGFTPREMAMVMMVHLLFSTACMLSFGRLSDFIGRKGLFMTGSVLFTASSLLGGLAQDAWTLLAARAVQGVGDAMTFGVAGAILFGIVPPERTGRAVGFNVMFVFAGLTLGPLVGGVLTSWLSWRVTFFVCAAAGVAAWWLIRQGYRERPGRGAGAMPWGDAAWFTASMLGLIFGVSTQPSWRGAALATVSGWMLARFARGQSGRSHPLVDVDYLGCNRPFALSNMVSALGYAAAFSTSFLLSLLMQTVLGMAAHDAGFLLLVQPLVQALASPLAGRVADRLSPGRVSAAGLMVLGAGLLVVAWEGSAATAWWLAGVQVVLGLGFALFVSPNFQAVMSNADAGHKGMASGLMATMRGLGMCASMSATGLLLALLAGGAGQAVPVDALRACFVLFGVVGLGAACLSWHTGGVVSTCAEEAAE
ncbi:Riboflavin transporter RibZ [Fundidesulfovibrio magnetotacticus]|uniref:Riboflavin transporter RibZ n=1 Tax=Fundidesulfovibrio magnetotacticus TaxID=2730080 RepID=A0A6V8LSS2_9BACT|nr:MFS transporter [Fundidesulfovibrio magnetotacticus]GFK92667.1 Riboflavin transporter RibZ [Fundidesulfovibrio magnetotacticus]